MVENVFLFLKSIFNEENTFFISKKVLYRWNYMTPQGHHTKSYMSEAGFELRKWRTNDSQLQKFFDEKETKNLKENQESKFIESQFATIENNEDTVKVLGISWDTGKDLFTFNFSEFLKMARSLKMTKRNILKASASIYDPLGFLSPITTRVKTIFQILCRDKSEWDAPINNDIEKVWTEFLKDIELLKHIQIPRFVFVQPNTTIKSIQMHGFCDSSKQAYCAVIYLRIETSVGVKVSFLAAKTKVAPLKTLTIPRLELLGCVLLSALVEEVKRGMENRVPNFDVFCWNDSKVALCWIKGKEKIWKPWVENRVVRIRKVVDRGSWRHVAGELNTADIPTRMSNFEGLDRWFRGPEFLHEEGFEMCDFDDEQTLNTEGDVVSKVFVEQKALFVGLAETREVVESSLSNIIEVKRFSSLRKLISVTCFVVRFVRNCVRKVRGQPLIEGEIDAHQYEDALSRWIGDEQTKLRNDRNFKKRASSLKLYDDEHGVTRLRGRFENAFPATHECHPIFLRDGDSYFTELMIRDAHDRTLHQGVESTLSRLRARFWITRGRQAVKKILRRCVVCQRHQGRTLLAPSSPTLPNFRICKNFAFLSVGLDYAGPLYIRNKDVMKVYILLLTCASSRAIHLELTPDMKEQTFIRAFTRFTSRRGSPELVIHDNFQTFRSMTVKRFMTHNGVTQQFILPNSPWWGGFYERLVRSVKLTLKKTIGKSLLTYEELETKLCEIEAIINSRPLVYVSEDDTHEALTPNHLIYGRNINVKAYAAAPDQPKKRVVYLNRTLQDCWSRFQQVYLKELMEFHTYRKTKTSEYESLRVGDVTLIKSENEPRQAWRLGRVKQLVRGSDGKVRGAQLKVISKKGARTLCYQPLQKLVHFEIRNEAGSAADDVTSHNTDVQDLTTESTVPDEQPENDQPEAVQKIARKSHGRNKRRPTRSAALNGQLLRRLRQDND